MIEVTYCTQYGLDRLLFESGWHWIVARSSFRSNMTCKDRFRLSLTTRPIKIDHNLLALVNQVLRRLHSLRPLGPASVVQAALFCGEASLGQSSVDDGSCDAGAAAGDDGLRGVDVLGREDFLQLGCGQEGLGGGVEEIRDGDGDRVGDVSGGET